MYIVDRKIVSSELFEKKFVCNLSKCKGACCWEGDYGAPLEDEEVSIIEELIALIAPNLSEEAVDAIRAQGVAPYSKMYGGKVTPLLKDGSCAYLIRDKDGIAKCSFEKLFNEGQSNFRKPISCHLYPVRVSHNKRTGFEALNYDEWEICSAACQLGEELKVSVFQFVKEALIRKYGEEFYEQLDDISDQYFS